MLRNKKERRKLLQNNGKLLNSLMFRVLREMWKDILRRSRNSILYVCRFLRNFRIVLLFSRHLPFQASFFMKCRTAFSRVFMWSSVVLCAFAAMFPVIFSAIFPSIFPKQTLLFAQSSAAPRNFFFERLTVDNGLSQGHVICMLQDRRGFMWFGTEDGLNRFDGISVKLYKNMLPSNYIEALYEDREGTLWVGTKSGLAKYDRATEKFTSYQSSNTDSASLPKNYVTSIVDDISSSFLWVGTYGGGLARLDKVTKKFTTFRKNTSRADALPSDIIWRLTADKSGAIWVGTFKGGIARHMAQSNTFLRFQPDSAASGELFVQSLCTDHNGMIWAGTNNGLWRLEYRPITRTGDFTHYKADPADPTALKSPIINAVLSDRSGRIWAGSNSGLHLFDRVNEQFTHYKHDSADPNSLVNDEVTSLYEDRSGTIWVGTMNGVSFFNPRATKFVTYRPETGRTNSLFGSVVWSFAELPDGRPWVGTEEGLNRLEAKPLSGVGAFSVFRKNDNLPNQLQDNHITALCTARDGSLWIGTNESGVQRLQRPDVYGLGSFESYLSDDSNPKSLSSNIISSIIEDKQGRIWISTSEGVNRFDGTDASGRATFTRIGSNPKNLATTLSNPAVTSLLADAQGFVWAGTENGLSRINVASLEVKSYRVLDESSDGAISQIGADNNAIQSLLETKDGRIWIGTQGGLYTFDRASEKFTGVLLGKKSGSYATRQQSISAVLGLLEDSAGSIWISSNQGLCRYTPLDSSARFYDTRDGLQGKEFITGAAFKSRSGLMYFGGVNGFNVFHPDSLRQTSIPPPVVLTEFSRYDEPIPLDSSISEIHTITLPHNQSTFDIKFAALSYSFAGRNLYKYFLEGYDEDWHETMKNDVRYTNLPPGEYTFRVKACNYDGVWNEEGLRLRIVIDPPFWHTWWFRLGALIAAAGTIFGGVRWRVKAVQDQNKRLAEQVEERTKQWREANESLTGANEEIMRQNEVLQGQAREIELAHTSLQEKSLAVEKTLNELKQTQMQLVQSEKMASLGQLTAGVAHEINNPVNFISGAVKPLGRNLNILRQTLEQYAAIKPEEVSPAVIAIVQQQLRDIHDYTEEAQLDVRLQQIDDLVGNIGVGAERIAEIVKILRNFSRLDEGALKRVSLHEGIDASLRLLHNQYKNRSLSIVKNYGDVPEVMCFPGPINQVFMNIIHNATQAIKDSGEVRITTEVDKTNPKNIIVRVSDNGVGIPPEVQKRIFEPFYTTKEAGVGTGLGLSISADIIAKHQGIIQVKSELGFGTEFSIVLPIDGPHFGAAKA
ncbi:MAG: hypothetical protein EAZ92_06670 [Candidatus Kapaibacterium sp.]|nr:MAG: hypothetical protein EAZ92_06670 [Candidatus Kapabacteria bacterium]